MQDYYKMSDNKQFQDLFPEMYPEAINRHDLKTMTTKNVTFVTTESCNLACTYCYQCDKNNTRFMTKEVAKTAVENMFDKTKMKKYLNEDLHKCVIIEFIGGEPFLNVDVMDFTVDYFRYLAYKNNSVWAKNYMINVTTNGTLNHTEKVKKFIEKNKERLSVSITIDGDKKLHDSCRVFHDGTGSYDVVYRNVQEAIQLFGLNSTKVTFAPENIDKINTAIPHLFNIGLTNINANCVFENVWKPEHAQIFYKELLQLADYMIENKIYKTGYCSIFDETIGQPMPETENKNWCFKAGTKILTPNGNINIEDLSIGDKVISGDGSIQCVEKTNKRQSNNTAILKASNVDDTYTTLEHPYLVKKNNTDNIEWINVKNIKKGDKIAYYYHCSNLKNKEIDFKNYDELHDILWCDVIDIITDCDSYEVYNLTVSNTHTFIANGCIVHNCGGDGQMLAIGTDGTIYPCIRYMKYSLSNKNRKEIVIGNVNDGLIDKEENPLFEEMCGITRRSQSTDECFYCPVGSGCSWCTAWNYDVFGTTNKRATFICIMHKARVLANYYYWNKVFKLIDEERIEKGYQPLKKEFKLNLNEEEIDFISSGKGIPKIQ